MISGVLLPREAVAIALFFVLHWCTSPQWRLVHTAFAQAVFDHGPYTSEYVLQCTSGGYTHAQGKAACASRAGGGWQMATFPTSASLAHFGANSTDFPAQRAWIAAASNGRGGWSWVQGRLAGQQFIDEESSAAECQPIRYVAGTTVRNFYACPWDASSTSGTAVATAVCATTNGVWTRAEACAPSPASSVRCVACERSPCILGVDCSRGGTLSIANGYFPNCQCACKDGYEGDRCERTVVNHGLYTSEYEIICPRVVNYTEGKASCSVRGHGWEVATFPSLLALAAMNVHTTSSVTTWFGSRQPDPINEPNVWRWDAGRLSGTHFSTAGVCHIPHTYRPIGSTVFSISQCVWYGNQPNGGTAAPCGGMQPNAAMRMGDFECYAVNNCTACERSPCDINIDCSALATESMAGDYYPNCTCTCKPGYGGPKCDITLVDHGLYRSEYSFTCTDASAPNYTAAQAQCLGRGSGWALASFPTPAALAAFEAQRGAQLAVNVWVGAVRSPLSTSQWMWGHGRLQSAAFLDASTGCLPVQYNPVGTVKQIFGATPSLCVLGLSAAAAGDRCSILSLSASGKLEGQDCTSMSAGAPADQQCYACERSPCDINIDCSALATESMAGDYYPNCTCNCKPGYGGPKCNVTLVDHGLYRSEYLLDCGAQGGGVTHAAAASRCSSRGSGWALASFPTSASLSAFAPQFGHSFSGSTIVGGVGSLGGWAWSGGRLRGARFWTDGSCLTTGLWGFAGGLQLFPECGFIPSGGPSDCVGVSAVSPHDSLVDIGCATQHMCAACERSPCNMGVDCYAPHTASMGAGAYYPNCTCACKVGFDGPRCQWPTAAAAGPFGVTQYRLVHSPDVTYASAVQGCAALSDGPWSLATLPTAEGLGALEDALFGKEDRVAAWVGAHDVTGQGSWRWDGGGRLAGLPFYRRGVPDPCFTVPYLVLGGRRPSRYFTHCPWADGMPSRAVGLGSCGALAMSSEWGRMQMVDRDCGEALGAYVCERSQCTMELDCYAPNTVAITAGTYYPSCTCTCRAGASGKRCEYYAANATATVTASLTQSYGPTSTPLLTRTGAVPATRSRELSSSPTLSRTGTASVTASQTLPFSLTISHTASSRGTLSSTLTWTVTASQSASTSQSVSAATPTGSPSASSVLTVTPSSTLEVRVPEKPKTLSSEGYGYRYYVHTPTNLTGVHSDIPLVFVEAYSAFHTRRFLEQREGQGAVRFPLTYTPATSVTLGLALSRTSRRSDSLILNDVPVAEFANPLSNVLGPLDYVTDADCQSLMTMNGLLVQAASSTADWSLVVGPLLQRPQCRDGISYAGAAYSSVPFVSGSSLTYVFHPEDLSQGVAYFASRVWRGDDASSSSPSMVFALAGENMAAALIGDFRNPTRAPAVARPMPMRFIVPSGDANHTVRISDTTHSRVACTVGDQKAFVGDYIRINASYTPRGAQTGCYLYDTVDDLHLACANDPECLGFTTIQIDWQAGPHLRHKELPLCMVSSSRAAQSPDPMPYRRMLYTKPVPSPCVVGVQRSGDVAVYVQQTSLDLGSVTVRVNGNTRAVCGGVQPFRNGYYGTSGRCNLWALCYSGQVYANATVTVVPTGVLEQGGCTNSFGVLVVQTTTDIDQVGGGERVPPRRYSIGGSSREVRRVASGHSDPIRLFVYRSLDVMQTYHQRVAPYTQAAIPNLPAASITFSTSPTTAVTAVTASPSSLPPLVSCQQCGGLKGFLDGVAGDSDMCDEYQFCGPAMTLSAPSSGSAEVDALFSCGSNAQSYARTEFTGMVLVAADLTGMSQQLARSCLGFLATVNASREDVNGSNVAQPSQDPAHLPPPFPLVTVDGRFSTLVGVASGGAFPHPSLGSSATSLLSVGPRTARVDAYYIGLWSQPSVTETPARTATTSGAATPQSPQDQLMPNATQVCVVDHAMERAAQCTFYIPRGATHVKVKAAQTDFATKSMTVRIFANSTSDGLLSRDVCGESRFGSQMGRQEACDTYATCSGRFIYPDDAMASMNSQGTVVVDLPAGMRSHGCDFVAVVIAEFTHSDLPRVVCDPSSEFECLGDRRCIPSSYVCDGIQDCDSGMDEESCTQLATLSDSTFCVPNSQLFSSHSDSYVGCLRAAVQNRSALFRTVGSVCSVVEASAAQTILGDPESYLCEQSPSSSSSSASTSTTYLSLSKAHREVFGLCRSSIQCFGNGVASTDVDTGRCTCQCDEGFTGQWCDVPLRLEGITEVACLLIDTFGLFTAVELLVPLAVIADALRLESDLVAMECSAVSREELASDASVPLVRVMCSASSSRGVRSDVASHYRRLLRSASWPAVNETLVTKGLPILYGITGRTSMTPELVMPPCVADTVTGHTQCEVTSAYDRLRLSIDGNVSVLSIAVSTRRAVVHQNDADGSSSSLDGGQHHSFSALSSMAQTTTVECMMASTAASGGCVRSSCDVALSGSAGELIVVERVTYAAGSLFTVPCPSPGVSLAAQVSMGNVETLTNLTAVMAQQRREGFIISGSMLLAAGSFVCLLAGAIFWAIAYWRRYSVYRDTFAAKTKGEADADGQKATSQHFGDIFGQGGPSSSPLGPQRPLSPYYQRRGEMLAWLWVLRQSVTRGAARFDRWAVVAIIVGCIFSSIASALVVLYAYEYGVEANFALMYEEYNDAQCQGSSTGYMPRRILSVDPRAEECAMGQATGEAVGATFVAGSCVGTDGVYSIQGFKLGTSRTVCRARAGHTYASDACIPLRSLDPLATRDAYVRLSCSSADRVRGRLEVLRGLTAHADVFAEGELLEPSLRQISGDLSRPTDQGYAVPYLSGRALRYSTSFTLNVLASQATARDFDDDATAQRIVLQLPHCAFDSAGDASCAAPMEQFLLDSMGTLDASTASRSSASLVPAVPDAPIGFLFGGFGTSQPETWSGAGPTAHRYYGAAGGPFDMGAHLSPDASLWTDGDGYAISLWLRADDTTLGFAYAVTDAFEDVSETKVHTLERLARIIDGSGGSDDWFDTTYKVYHSLYVNGPGKTIVFAYASPTLSGRVAQLSFDLEAMGAAHVVNGQWHHIAVTFTVENARVIAQLVADGRTSYTEAGWTACVDGDLPEAMSDVPRTSKADNATRINNADGDGSVEETVFVPVFSPLTDRVTSGGMVVVGYFNGGVYRLQAHTQAMEGTDFLAGGTGTMRDANAFPATATRMLGVGLLAVAGLLFVAILWGLVGLMRSGASSSSASAGGAFYTDATAFYANMGAIAMDEAIPLAGPETDPPADNVADSSSIRAETETAIPSIVGISALPEASANTDDDGADPHHLQPIRFTTALRWLQMSHSDFGALMADLGDESLRPHLSLANLLYCKRSGTSAVMKGRLEGGGGEGGGDADGTKPNPAKGSSTHSSCTPTFTVAQWNALVRLDAEDAKSKRDAEAEHKAVGGSAHNANLFEGLCGLLDEARLDGAVPPNSSSPCTKQPMRGAALHCAAGDAPLPRSERAFSLSAKWGGAAPPPLPPSTALVGAGAPADVEDRRASSVGVFEVDFGAAGGLVPISSVGAPRAPVGGGAGAGDVTVAAAAGFSNPVAGLNAASIGEYISSILNTIQLSFLWMSSVGVPQSFKDTFDEAWSFLAFDFTATFAGLGALVTPMLQAGATLVVLSVFYYCLVEDNRSFYLLLTRYVWRRDAITFGTQRDDDDNNNTNTDATLHEAFLRRAQPLTDDFVDADSTLPTELGNLSLVDGVEAVGSQAKGTGLQISALDEEEGVGRPSGDHSQVEFTDGVGEHPTAGVPTSQFPKDGLIEIGHGGGSSPLHLAASFPSNATPGLSLMRCSVNGDVCVPVLQRAVSRRLDVFSGRQKEKKEQRDAGDTEGAHLAELSVVNSHHESDAVEERARFVDVAADGSASAVGEEPLAAPRCITVYTQAAVPLCVAKGPPPAGGCARLREVMAGRFDAHPLELIRPESIVVMTGDGPPLPVDRLARTVVVGAAPLPIPCHGDGDGGSQQAAFSTDESTAAEDPRSVPEAVAPPHCDDVSATKKKKNGAAYAAVEANDSSDYSDVERCHSDVGGDGPSSHSPCPPPHKAPLATVGVSCPFHEGVLLTMLCEQTAVWPPDNRVRCCVEGCGASLGEMYSCGHHHYTRRAPREEEGGGDDDGDDGSSAADSGDAAAPIGAPHMCVCTYALCKTHYRPSGVAQSLLGLAWTHWRQIKAKGPQWVLCLLAFTCVDALYVPFMKTALMIVSCHPYYRCELGDCWAAPTSTFILSAMVAIIVMAVLGVGVPLALCLSMRQRSEEMDGVGADKASSGAADADTDSSSGSSSDWERIVACDATAMAGRYCDLRLGWFYFPSLLYLTRLCQVLPAVLAEPKSVEQRYYTAGVQLAITALFFLCQPYRSTALTYTLRGTEAYRVAVLGLTNLELYYRNALSPSAADTTATAMIALTIVYFAVTIGVALLTVVWPIVSDALKDRRLTRLLAEHGMCYGHGTSLFVDPTRGTRRGGGEPSRPLPNDASSSSSPPHSTEGMRDSIYATFMRLALYGGQLPTAASDAHNHHGSSAAAHKYATTRPAAALLDEAAARQLAVLRERVYGVRSPHDHHQGGAVPRDDAGGGTDDAVAVLRDGAVMGDSNDAEVGPSEVLGSVGGLDDGVCDPLSPLSSYRAVATSRPQHEDLTADPLQTRARECTLEEAQRRCHMITDDSSALRARDEYIAALEDAVNQLRDIHRAN